MDNSVTSPHGAGSISQNGAQLEHRRRILRQLKLTLVANGFVAPVGNDVEFTEMTRGLVESFHEKVRLLSDLRCPADARIESFLRAHFANLGLPYELRLPDQTLVLDQRFLARELSLPADGDTFGNDYLTSFRVKNGVLHNPRTDRRTTKGTFHVAEGGLPIPGDKKAVPKRVFAELFRHAMNPPEELLTLPYTVAQPAAAKTFVSLLLRPLVCPAVPGFCPERSMEIRFFAPAAFVSNLDFVETIFGNAGDPFLPRNDAGLDVEHWTGNTGCVILAPHLVHLTKKQLGLPVYEQATPRQRADGMCWKDPGEKYNDGSAFKITCRTSAGVIVTLLADNYFGYCKKEVKTQISYAANLYGNVEEEHSGGAIAFTSFSFGDEYQFDSRRVDARTFADVVRDYGSILDVQPGGYAYDKNFPDLVYIPHDARASTQRQEVWWPREGGGEFAIPMLPGKVYMTPSGFKIRLEKHPGGAPSWRIVGTRGEGTFCHKPCTVSGGGKSEISKNIGDYMVFGPIFISDLEKDLELVDQIVQRDYANRWRPGAAVKLDYASKPSRPILGPERSLGSVIKLLTPSAEYTDEYNAWLKSLPNYIYPIVFVIKRFYKPEWNGNWREYFGVDIVNGFPGHELKYGERKLSGMYLRVGLLPHSWRIYKSRQDFAPADKLQMEDDITASVVVPAHVLGGNPEGPTSLKFVANCEERLFQRPDDAVHPGLDRQTEADLARGDNFISNFEPLTAADAARMVQRITRFDKFSAPMRELIASVAEAKAGYFVSSAHTRLVEGKPSKNPRYLQLRPDLADPMSRYVAEMGQRCSRGLAPDQPLRTPVDAVFIGRRNNPPEPEAGIRGMAVYNPMHYQELPELFMDFICSLTGKSPSTTGAGSEGALTKSPFNALRPTIDLNNALVSFILTGLHGFSSAAGYIGPQLRVDHDISLLVPEIWCRLTPAERDPARMIAEGYLEPLANFEHQGQTILASRLGYRITARFVRAYFGRVFDNPSKVFEDAILKPETQDMEAFVDGIKNITEAQQRVAQEYLADGSIDDACPPLKAILHIMAEGQYEGKTEHDPEIRRLFTTDYLLGSEWYRARLKAKQQQDAAMWRRHLAYLEEFLAKPSHRDVAAALDIAGRRDYAARQLSLVNDKGYAATLVGTLGVDPTALGKP